MPAKEGGIVPFSLLKLRSLHGQLKHSALQYIVILQSLQTCLQMFKICPVANVMLPLMEHFLSTLHFRKKFVSHEN